MSPRILLTVFIFLIGFMGVSNAQIEMAAKMAETIMKEYGDSLVVKPYVNHLVKDAQAEKAKSRPANWNYEIGVVLTGFERLWKETGDHQYIQYTKKIIDHFVDSKGQIRTYNNDDFNLDNIPSGRQLLTLYYTYRDKKYLAAAGLLKNQLDWQPRTKEGGYWHKLRYPYQMWLDGQYMGQPFRTEYLIATKNDKEWDDVANQFIWMAEGAYDEKTGLLYHAFDESRFQKWSDPKTGKSPEFWSRAMGWYMLGIVDVLESFPIEHPKRAKLIKIYTDLSNALLKYQDPASKTWWQVTDKGGQQGNYLESSGSSMFIASILKGMRLGFLPMEMKADAMAGYEGLLKEFITKDDQGTYHLVKAVTGAGLGGSPYRDGTYEYYVKEPTRDDDLKAIGPFMQAAIEYELATKAMIGTGKKVVLDRYFNNEYKDEERFHYTWEDKFDSGFSWFGSIFTGLGASLENLDTAPTPQNLSKADVYIIVDPDNTKESPSPNYIEKSHVDAIAEWVSKGGTLILMTNDTTNAEIIRSNMLPKAFGIEFTMKNINFVQNDNFPDGAVYSTKNNAIFTPGRKFYVKELVTLKTKKNVQKVAEIGKDVVMASATWGKGKVFVIGDPWLYNEYLSGRKLPSEYQNFEGAVELAKWSLIK